ncbi:MAG: hypothetical protein JW956_08135 [Calditrichaceae bacterium]|nr:hypothetical protein [Calditrichaceae bacterium]
MADMAPSITPYHYVSNNPLSFIDPFGLWEIRFDQNGNWIENYDDGSEDIFGAVYEYDEDGNMGDKTMDLVFNHTQSADPYADDGTTILDDFTGGYLTGVDLNFESSFNMFMSKSGANEDKGFFGKYLYALTESDGGNLDFTTYGELSQRKLHMAGGVAYNFHDASNFLWGMAMGKLGFSNFPMWAGSNLNAFWDGQEQYNGISKFSWTGDATEDQRAINRGCRWSKNPFWRTWRK